ncbi:hypothetical protein [Thermodesulfatator autotrophicus]|uniref:Uncharacterized protein n=1 Tax=Thermodesulfatator autotrophicus TaxID=1795632 RepID=A0A177E5M1_9BACT|nr:hypothetical protein [Thermodesulfatator autotrophicus]OAG27263.1 hypothetical protein TH606_07900 [Thermodesulfatator autotrophicus]
MSESLKIYFLIANRIYITDAIRSTLGQAIENHYSHACIFYQKMPKLTDYVKENMEWIRDMEGDVFYVVDTIEDEEAKKYNEEVGLTPITLEELAQKLKEADVIIPYGLPRQKHDPPPACAD